MNGDYVKLIPDDDGFYTIPMNFELGKPSVSNIMYDVDTVLEKLNKYKDTKPFMFQDQSSVNTLEGVAGEIVGMVQDGPVVSFKVKTLSRFKDSIYDPCYFGVSGYLKKDDGTGIRYMSHITGVFLTPFNRVKIEDN